MSPRLALSRAADHAAFAALSIGARAGRGRIAFLPVLHVERLDLDAHLDGLLRYCEGYSRITGKRPVATVLTPLSPLLARLLAEGGIDAGAYAERIARLQERAIIGLHGHFVRTGQDGSMRPMQESFFDRAALREQIRAETEWLTARGLMAPARKIYSAGWWFMNSVVMGILRDEGYRYDFSIAANRFCHSGAAWRERKRMGSLGHILRPGQAADISGAAALCAASVPGRPKAAFRRLAVEPSLRGHRWQDGTYLTLFGHDYDLAPDEGIETARLLHARGYGFFEPSDLDAQTC